MGRSELVRDDPCFLRYGVQQREISCVADLDRWKAIYLGVPKGRGGTCRKRRRREHGYRAQDERVPHEAPTDKNIPTLPPIVEWHRTPLTRMSKIIYHQRGFGEMSRAGVFTAGIPLFC